MNSETGFEKFCDFIVDSVYKSWLGVKPVSDGYPFPPWLEGFDKCVTDYERMKLCFNLVSSNEIEYNHYINANRAGKSDFIAKSYRELGNEAWKQNKIGASLLYYAHAIFTADSSEEKALAFGNRSCVLARIEAHSEVLADIELAFKHNFPADRRSRLSVRKAQSLIALGRFQEALDHLKNTLSDISSSDSSTSKALVIIINENLNKCEVALKRKENLNEKCLTSSLMIHFPDTLLTNPSSEPNKQNQINKNNDSIHSKLVRAQNLSPTPAVKLKHTDEAGWHFVATRIIKPGELLILDEPYTCHLNYDRLMLNCYRCFRRCLNLLPCRGCNEVGFCSEDCEQAAWDPVWSEDKKISANPNLPYHRYECGFIKLIALNDFAGFKRIRKLKIEDQSKPSLMNCKRYLDKFCSDEDVIGGPNISWLSYSCISRTDPEVIKNLAQKSIENLKFNSTSVSNPELSAFSGRRCFPQSGWDDYTTISSLITNSEKRKTIDLWQRCVAAVYLTYCLKLGGYPMEWTNNQSNLIPAEWIATCLLHHIQVNSSNAHTFSCDKYMLNKDCLDQELGIDLNKFENIELASCLYPSLSLMNHSCDPNTCSVYMNNGRCGIYSLRLIKTNELIWTNYGLHYAVHSKEIRQNSLASQYYFQCNCIACEENWPQFNNNIANSFNQMKIKCPNCFGLVNNNSSSLNKLRTNSSPSTTNNNCTCSLKHQSFLIQKYNEVINVKITQKIFQIIENFQSKHSFKQITTKFLKLQLNNLMEFLQSYNTELYDVIVRPHATLDWMQELLKLLFTLNYGIWTVENNFD